MPHSSPLTNDDYSIAVVGGGSAAEALLRQLAPTEHRVVVFEDDLLGGECPFYACMPSKAMLHDRSIGRSWDQAVARRQEIVDHLDDAEHATEAERLGATLVRARASVTGPGTVCADGVDYRVDHVMLATGAQPIVPDIVGLDLDHRRVWTSKDALTASERPGSLIVIGTGVIGSELAFTFAGFGTQVTALDTSERPAADLHPAVGRIIAATLERGGVDLVGGADVDRVELADDGVVVHEADGTEHRADQLLVAVGRAPAHGCLELDRFGLDAVEVDDIGRLSGTENVWILGDAVGGDQYTHVANHHAAVVADHVAGDQIRRYDDVVVPACIFLDPPVVVVGPTWAELADDGDIVWAEIDVDTPRGSTDEHRSGFLAVAARASTGCVVAAHGVGDRFDEVVHALVVAIDGQVPVERLAQMLQPFPTVGEVLGQAFRSLRDQLVD